MIRKKVYMFLCMGLILLAGGCKSEEVATNNVPKEKGTPVEVMKITKGSIVKTDTYSSQIQPSQGVVVNTQTPGEVAQVNFDMGDQVAKGDVLFTMDKRAIQNQIESLENQMASVIVSYNAAKESFDDMKVLYDEGAVSQQQYDQAETVFEQAKTSKSALEIQLKNTREALGDLEVRSPIDGVVAERNIDVGEMVGAGLPPFTILSMDTLYIDVNVPETLINSFQLHKEVDVRVESAQQEPFKGVIARMSPISDQTTHTYPIRIEIANQQQQIKPGMFAEVIFELERRDSVITIPRTALSKLGEQWYAFIVEENIGRKVPVEIGLDEGMILEVTEGLKEGQQLITKGKEYVKDGEQVHVVNK